MCEELPGILTSLVVRRTLIERTRRTCLEVKEDQFRLSTPRMSAPVDPQSTVLRSAYINVRGKKDNRGFRALMSERLAISVLRYDTMRTFFGPSDTAVALIE